MSSIKDQVISQLNKEKESAERMERLGKIFGWKYFQKAKPFHFTVSDRLAQADSGIYECQKNIEASRAILSKLQ